MVSDIHNISVLTANLFLSCRDSHSNSCQRAYEVEWIIPPRCLSTNQTERAMTQFLWQRLVWWHAAKEQRPQLGRAARRNNEEHLHRPCSTFQNRAGEEQKNRKNQLRTVAAGRRMSVSLRCGNTAAYCARRRG